MLKTQNEEIKLQTFETDNGFVGVKVPILEEGKIQVKYTGTWLMNVSNFVSLVGVCIFIGICLKKVN